MSGTTDGLTLTTDDLKKLLEGTKPSWAVILGPYVAMAILLAVGLAFLRPHSDGPTPKPDQPIAAIEAEAREAFAADAEAEYFAHVCDHIAEALEADGKTKQPRISTREQASESLCGAICRFSCLHLSADAKVDQAKLRSLVGNRFDEASEFPQTAGPLSQDDRAKAVSRFREIAHACKQAH